MRGEEKYAYRTLIVWSAIADSWDQQTGLVYSPIAGSHARISVEHFRPGGGAGRELRGHARYPAQARARATRDESPTDLWALG